MACAIASTPPNCWHSAPSAHIAMSGRATSLPAAPTAKAMVPMVIARIAPPAVFTTKPRWSGFSPMALGPISMMTNTKSTTTAPA